MSYLWWMSKEVVLVFGEETNCGLTVLMPSFRKHLGSSRVRHVLCSGSEGFAAIESKYVWECLDERFRGIKVVDISPNPGEVSR